MFIEKRLPEKLKGDTMTIAEQLILRGEQRGVQIGEQRGEQRGLQKGFNMSAKAIRMLLSGMYPELVAQELQLPLEFVQELQDTVIA